MFRTHHAIPLLGFTMIVFAVALSRPALGVNKTYLDVGLDSWNVPFTWSPNGLPTTNDRVFIDVDDAVTLFTDTASVDDLFLSGGAELRTGGFRLRVDDGDNTAETHISGAGTRIVVTGIGLPDHAFGTDVLHINNGGLLEIAGGVTQVEKRLIIASGGTIAGNRIVTISGTQADKLSNSGAIRAEGGTLYIQSSNEGDFDLDGGGGGILEAVDGISTLVINGDLGGDDFSGMVNIGAGNAIRFDQAWATDTGTINFDATRGTGILAGSQLNHGGTMNVNAGTAQIDAPIVFESSSIANVAIGATLDFSHPVNFQNGNLNLAGGSVTGSQITNNGTIGGHGTVDARIVNDSDIRAEGGGALIFEPASLTNNYDGIAGGGKLYADSADLVLRNPMGAIQTFEGLMSVSSGQELFVDGFRLAHGPSARLELSNSVYHVNRGGTINGEIRLLGSIAGAPSRIVNEPYNIVIEPNSYSLSPLIFSSTSNVILGQSLGRNLEIDSLWTTVEAGATFSGDGSLIIVEKSSLSLSEGAQVGVHVVNHGRLANRSFYSNPDLTVAATVSALTQTSTGVIQFDLGGAAPGLFDVLFVENNAILGGALNVDLLSGFTPVVGNSFTILETTFGNVDGMFAVEDLPVFNGLTFDVIYNPKSVVLEVIADISVDTEPDGDVDGADFLALQRDNPALIPQWQLQYGSGAALTASQSVPEPGAWLLATAAISMALIARGARC